MRFKGLPILFLGFAACCWAAETIKPFDPKSIVVEFLGQNDFGKSQALISQWEELPLPQRLAIIDELMSHLASTQKLAITNTGNAMSEPRVQSGEMQSYGMGSRTTQDFFIVGGKAAWAISLMLDFSSTGIAENMSDADRKSAIVELEMMVRLYKRGVDDGRRAASTAPASQR